MGFATDTPVANRTYRPSKGAARKTGRAPPGYPQEGSADAWRTGSPPTLSRPRPERGAPIAWQALDHGRRLTDRPFAGPFGFDAGVWLRRGAGCAERRRWVRPLPPRAPTHPATPSEQVLCRLNKSWASTTFVAKPTISRQSGAICLNNDKARFEALGRLGVLAPPRKPRWPFSSGLNATHNNANGGQPS